jgi:hypothetical protein
MSDRLALANAIEDAGIERAKAERVASVIFDAIHDNVATKADVQALGGELRPSIAALGAELRPEIAAVRRDLGARIDLIEHRLLTRLGGLAVVLTGIIIAVLHYWQPGHSG